MAKEKKHLFSLGMYYVTTSRSFQSYVQMELEFTFGPVIGELFVTPLLA